MGGRRQRAWRPGLLVMSMMLSGNAFLFYLTQTCCLSDAGGVGGTACLHSERQVKWGKLDCRVCVPGTHCLGA